jgi:hypothetical protein
VLRTLLKFLFVACGGPWPLEDTPNERSSDGSPAENKRNIAYHYDLSNAFAACSIAFERNTVGPVPDAGLEEAPRPIGPAAHARGSVSLRPRPRERDDHERSAPSSHIIGTKLGKLVAMKDVSSTCTGFSLARPIIRNAMAMR